MNNIGNKITNLRKNHTMSQEQLAELMHVSRQSVSKWERNEALPDIYNLKALADVFEISVDNLIGDEPIDKDNINSEDNASFSISNNEISKEDMLNREELLSKANLIRIIAIAMYIISPFMWLGLEEGLNLQEGLISAIFGIMIASATALIIYSAFISSKAKRLYGPINRNDEEENEEKFPLLSSVIYTTATLVFLYIGFFHNLWHPGWIVFIAAALIVKIIELIAAAMEKNQINGN